MHIFWLINFLQKKYQCHSIEIKIFLYEQRPLILPFWWKKKHPFTSTHLWFTIGLRDIKERWLLERIPHFWTWWVAWNSFPGTIGSVALHIRHQSLQLLQSNNAAACMIWFFKLASFQHILAYHNGGTVWKGCYYRLYLRHFSIIGTAICSLIFPSFTRTWSKFTKRAWENYQRICKTLNASDSSILCIW